MSDPSAIDPEEAFVGAITSCHMLWFLSLAAAEGLIVEGYEDQPVGCMEKNSDDQLAVTRVTLRPTIRFGGSVIPTAATVQRIHDEAHRRCFIANSVHTRIDVVT